MLLIIAHALDHRSRERRSTPLVGEIIRAPCRGPRVTALSSLACKTIAKAAFRPPIWLHASDTISIAVAALKMQWFYCCNAMPSIPLTSSPRWRSTVGAMSSGDVGSDLTSPGANPGPFIMRNGC